MHTTSPARNILLRYATEPGDATGAAPKPSADPTTAQTEPGKGTGTGFTPITSQDALDRVLGARLAREREKFTDYDDLKAKAAKFDAAQDAGRSEQDRIAERISALEDRAARAEERAAASQAAAMRAEVAAAKGVPLTALTGTDRTQVEALADALIAWRDTQSKGLGPGASNPKANGTTTTPKPGSLDRGRAIFNDLLGARGRQES